MRIVVFILIPYKYMLYSQSLSEKEPKRGTAEITFGKRCLHHFGEGRAKDCTS